MPRLELLAIDFGAIVTMFFVLISVIGAVINATNSNKEKEKEKGNKRPRPKESSVRREIEEFLEQQGGRPPKPKQPMMLGEDDIEIVDEPVRRPVPPRPTNKPKPTPQRPAANRPANRPAQKAPTAQQRPKALAPTPVQKTSRPGERHVGSQDLGDGLRKHVQTAMGERMAAQAQKDVPQLTAAGVHSAATDKQLKDDLNAFKVTGKADASLAKASPIMRMLRDPGSVRNAVLLAEIMTRPRALRK